MDKKHKAEKSALYMRLNYSALSLWEFFKQFGGFKFLEEGRVPSPEEWSETEPLMGKLQTAVESSAEANCSLASLPRAMRPFFNIIPLLLLYFRSLKACLAGYKPGMAEEALARYREQLADCRNMAGELDRQWQERQELFQETSLMLDVCQNQAGRSPLASEAEGGALAQFIASSRIRRGF